MSKICFDVLLIIAGLAAMIAPLAYGQDYPGKTIRIENRPSGFIPGDVVAKAMKSDMARMGKVIKDAGIRAD